MNFARELKSSLKRPSVLSAMLLVLHCVAVSVSAFLHSPTVDEVGYLAAGLTNLREGTFGLYAVNPPLVRMTAAATILDVDWNETNRWGSAEPSESAAGVAGKSLIRHLGSSTTETFAYARLACLPFSVLAAIVCFAWARSMYGPWAGFTALALWSMSPMVLGHAATIHPDIAAASIGVLTCYCYRVWTLSSPCFAYTLMIGVASGFAVLSKFTWLIVLPASFSLCFLGSVACCVRFRREWRTRAVSLLCAVAISTFVVNLGYGFRGLGTPIGNIRFVSALLSEPADSEPNRFANTWLQDFPSPLPVEFLQGIDLQKRNFERTVSSWSYSYLMGEWRKGGWWYYYAIAGLVKIPLSTLMLFGVSIAMHIRLLRGSRFRWDAETRDGGKKSPQVLSDHRIPELLCLVIPVIVLCVLVSSQTGFNRHFRYVLPAFPMLFILTSGASLTGHGVRKMSVVVFAALGWNAVIMAIYAPHWMSYFNQAVGGPEHGGEWLLSSNIDYGQDIELLKSWADEHPDARPLHAAVFSGFDPRLIGLTYKEPSGWVARETAHESSPQIGWSAMSVNVLYGDTRPVYGQNGKLVDTGDRYAYFRKLTPVAGIGYSISIYNVLEEDIRNVAPSSSKSDSQSAFDRNMHSPGPKRSPWVTWFVLMIVAMCGFLYPYRC